MKTFVYQMKPGQRFTLLRSGKKYRFIRKDLSLPKGFRYVVILDDPYITSPDGPKETTLPHLCHVLPEVT